MTFTEQMKVELAKPLDRKNVKPPAPGKYGDYVEGWHVIAEANRIFGFDGWTRETVDMVETNRELKDGKWFVGFRCKVRVTAHGVFRDGSAFGSGVSKSIGDAVESAVKEAETDAMKRALMTFGNPFGLALYDKSHANVADAPPPLITDDQRDMIQTLATAAQVSLQTICEGYGIASLKELPASKYPALEKRLRQPQKEAA
jgi:DNA repair and recombination protein RAD52